METLIRNAVAKLASEFTCVSKIPASQLVVVLRDFFKDLKDTKVGALKEGAIRRHYYEDIIKVIFIVKGNVGICFKVSKDDKIYYELYTSMNSDDYWFFKETNKKTEVSELFDTFKEFNFFIRNGKPSDESITRGILKLPVRKYEKNRAYSVNRLKITLNDVDYE